MVKLACHILICVLVPLKDAIFGACRISLCLRLSAFEISTCTLRCNIRRVIWSYHILSVHTLTLILLLLALIRLRIILQIAEFAIVRLHIYLCDDLSLLGLFIFLFLHKFLLWLDSGWA